MLLSGLQLFGVLFLTMVVLRMTRVLAVAIPPPEDPELFRT